MDLIEMYPAAVNSKVTVTLGVLNADSTIIEVLDGSVLPDAPNLLVLGSDQTAETVKLTAKEGNTLTVERGIQGNAIAWPAGTQVARNFTAKDWDDLVTNVATIVAKIMGLNAEDVHARPDTWMPTASDVGALPKTVGITNATTQLTSGVHFLAFEISDENGTAGTPFSEGLTTSKGFAIISFATSLRNGFQIAMASGQSGSIFFSRSLKDSVVSEWTTAFLPLDGSVAMKGYLNFENMDTHNANIRSVGGGMVVGIKEPDGYVRQLKICTRDNGSLERGVEFIHTTDVETGSAKWCALLGEHNKPSGSYTGNGSAAARTIDVGGIGIDILFLIVDHSTANNDVVIVLSNGAVWFDVGGGKTTYISGSELNFRSGVLTIATTKECANQSTWNYRYYRP